MHQIVSIHSFRGGTGKSNITANVASLLAVEGKRVAIVDMDIQSPGVHVVFGLEAAPTGSSLNDYLWGQCSIAQASHDVTPVLGPGAPGALFVVPASLSAGDISRVLREGYDFNHMTDGIRDLCDELALDYLFLDTHPGINEETLFSIALSGLLFVILRPDKQDFLGTAVAVEVARQLDVPAIRVVLNKVPSSFDAEGLRAHVQRTLACEVAAVVPHSDELMELGSEGVFALRFPDHAVTRAMRSVADSVSLG